MFVLSGPISILVARPYNLLFTLANFVRCVFIVLFASEEGKTADEIFSSLLPWLQMVHVQAPGSRVMLVCSRSESPPAGVGLEQWKQTVKQLAGDVEAKVLLSRAVLSRRNDCIDRV